MLIHAGAGGVGHVAIQLARLAGARICTTVGSEPKAQFVKDCGAELVVNYKQHDFVQAVQDWSHGGGVNLALDTVGGKTFEKTFDAMRIYGDIVTLLQPEETVAWKQARIKNLRISLELMLSPMYLELEQERVRQTNILETCAKLFTNGELKIDVEKTFPLHEAAEAHRLIENGSMKGKAVLLLGNL